MRRREFVGLVAGAMTGPVVALAQQPAPGPAPVIGYLTSTTLADWAVAATRKGLDEAGYVEGRNLTVLYRSADGQFDRLPALAADLVSRQVSVIFAAGSPVPARAAKAATTTIPIVFAYGGDPVADGLVASFNRPGGNVTGATFLGSALTGKRMELLHEIVPRAVDVALLVNPNGTLAEGQIENAQAATRALGLRLHVINGGDEGEIDDAFATMSRLKVGALLISTDPMLGFARRDQLVALASRYRIPTMYDSRPAAAGGGLISYGTTLSDTWRDAGLYVGRILKGEKPSALPIIQSSKFEMIINLGTAKTLGLDIPSRLLATADDVIE
jgi:putative tryptophan/tyrosine transport system substrate-binding protein